MFISFEFVVHDAKKNNKMHLLFLYLYDFFSGVMRVYVM